MLDALRRGTGTWIAKIFIALLVVSFAVWGVADIFGGYGKQTVAKVGDAEISYDEYQEALQNQIRLIGERLNRTLSLDEARALGLDRITLSQLTAQAALENQGKALGLGITDAAIAERITREPAFQDASGRFSKEIFEQVLYANGLSEQGYVFRQRAAYVRDQIAETVIAGAPPPKSLIQAANLYRNETRTLKYVLLPQEKAEPVPQPGEEQLRNYYDTFKGSYKAPEYRQLGIIVLEPAAIAKNIKISEEDLKAYYQPNKDRFRTSATRNIQQLSFPDMETAQKAHERIKAGADFMEIAKERGLGESDVNLGTVSKGDLADPVIAEAAFELAEGDVSAPVKGQLNTVILKATDINPEKVTSFEQAKDKIQKILATDRAADDILDLHDKIEDERAAGSTLAEIAKKLDLRYVEIPAVDRQGNDPQGKPVGELPLKDKTLDTAFSSDIGVENDPIETTDQGFIWVQVLGLTPSRQKTFEEVRDQVARDWKAKEERDRLAMKAQELVNKARGGQSLEEIAGELGLTVKESKPLKRSDTTEDLPRGAVAQAFALSPGQFGSASVDGRMARAVFQVAVRQEPPALAESAAERLAETYQTQINADLVAQYVTVLQDAYGITINQHLINELTGREQ